MSNNRPNKKAVHPGNRVQTTIKRILFNSPINRQSQPMPSTLKHQQTGGGERNRTDDFLLAKQALYQLSYTPKTDEPKPVITTRNAALTAGGPGRI